MPDIVDDKSEHCIRFLLDCLDAHRQRNAGDAAPPPFFLGLNGVQGSGKSTLVRRQLNDLSRIDMRPISVRIGLSLGCSLLERAGMLMLPVCGATVLPNLGVKLHHVL